MHAQPSAMVDPEHRRALDLLASSRDGCPEALFLAHGFTTRLVDALVAAEHATVGTTVMRARGRTVPVRRLRITLAGRLVIGR
jgi:hypothetical protein